jgi:hypothetical protein
MFVVDWALAPHERIEVVTRFVAFALLVCASCSTASCGSAPSMIPTPAVQQISGEWLGEETVASLDGGECLASALEKDLVGLPGQFTGSFVQTGVNVTATLDLDHTGAVCSYSGTIDGNSLALDMTGCVATNGTPISCPAGGARDLRLLAEHVTAVIADDRISGTFAETDDILISGSTTSVGTLGTAGSFTLVRR